MTLGIWFQTGFLLNRKVLIQGAHVVLGGSDLACPFTWPYWACKCIPHASLTLDGLSWTEVQVHDSLGEEWTGKRTAYAAN